MLVRHRKAKAQGKQRPRNPPPGPPLVPPVPDTPNRPAKPLSSLPIREVPNIQTSPQFKQPRKRPPGALRGSNQSAASRDQPWTCAYSLRHKGGARGGRSPPLATNLHQAVPAVELNEKVNNQPLRLFNAGPGDEDDALLEAVAIQFDQSISSIDGEPFLSSQEEELLSQQETLVGLRGGWCSGRRAALPGAGMNSGASTDRSVASAIHGVSYFAKAKLYANSRLPSNLPSLNLYISAWPLVCLAAQYSRRAYTKPSGAEREAFVDADWRVGTKASLIQGVAIDDMNCVVFAIRGSQTFLDWAVNLKAAPVSPGDFLDDPGNFCHQGFLSVARNMIKPVAARLRFLLEEKPWRRSCSLIMTGHSAGGAVATLLYAHMLAESVNSELSILTGCFKRIHCLTFGSPPISLLPLTKPSLQRHRRSLFMSFVNEGDPVPRADKAYVRSLLSLYTSPAPSVGGECAGGECSLKGSPIPKAYGRSQGNEVTIAPKTVTHPLNMEIKWNVPPGTLSNAGRLVVLRNFNSNRSATTDDIRAEITCDQQMREVVFGDPAMHLMSVYARRIEVLATKAVTAKIWA